MDDLEYNLSVAPKANDDEYSVEAGAILDVPMPGVTWNDEVDLLFGYAVELVELPFSGNVSMNQDGSFKYQTFDNKFTGKDYFRYKFYDHNKMLYSNVATVFITVNPANDAPVAIAQTVSTNEDVALDITLSATDVDGDPLTYSIATQPMYGTLSGTAPNLTYTPNPNYNGGDSFSFSATDPSGASSTATVSITVNPVNDAPVLIGVPDTATIEELATYSFTATATDSDLPADTLIFSIVDAPLGAAITEAGAFSWTPAEDQQGVYTFTVKVSDGSGGEDTEEITVTVEDYVDERLLQAITFQEIPDKKISEGTFALSATASSGLPVTYTSSDPAVATISGNTVKLVGTGDAVITASQAGDAVYKPAADVKQILLVNPDVWPPVASSYAFGSRLSSSFSAPVRISTDSKGNIYVADRYNHRIQKFGTDGTLLLAFGSYGAGDAQFNQPVGVAVDLDGFIYVADYNNHRIQKFDSQGNFLLKFGNYGVGDGQFNLTAGVTVDWRGQVYVSDHLNNRIQKFTGNGEFVSAFGNQGSASGQFYSPADLAVDRRGNIYVADQNNHRVQKLSPKWEFMLQIGSHGSADGQFFYSPGVDVDDQGHIYITDMGNHRIQKFDASGQFMGKFGGQGSGDGQLTGPTGVAVGIDGNVYVADHGNNRVEIFEPVDNIAPVLEATGNKTTDELAPLNFQASAADDGLPANMLTYSLATASVGTFPTGASITEGGLFSWIPTEEQGPGTFRVKIVVSNGELTDEEEIAIQVNEVREAPVLNSNATCWPDATLNLSNAADASQIIWYKDGAAVDTVTSLLTTEGTTVAGGNGQGAEAIQLAWPQAVYIDGEGNAYISDFSNHRVQKWAPNAISGVTVAGGNGEGTADNQLSFPRSVFVDGSGSIFVVDGGNNRVQKWAPGAATGSTVISDEQLVWPWGVFVDGGGNIYVSDYGANQVLKWAPGASNGIVVAGGNGAGAAANQLNNPFGLSVDGGGNIYVADSKNHRIQKWKPGATEGVTVAGGNGAGAAANQLDTPHGIFVDGSGNIFVADYFNNRVQKWQPGAAVGITVSGGNGRGSASIQLASPSGVFVAGDGNIYVADMDNNRVQRWAAPFIATTFTPTEAGIYTAEVIFSSETLTTNAVTIEDALPVSVSIAADPSTTIIAGTAVTFTATPTNGGDNPVYQWKVNGVVVEGDTAATFSTSTLVNGDKVTCELTSNAACTMDSPVSSSALSMTVNTLSTAPSSITASSVIIFEGGSSILSVVGGALGTEAEWKWYSTNCGGMAVGAGESINVSPTETTIYFVRAESPYNTTSCASVKVRISPVLRTISSATCLPDATLNLSHASDASQVVWNKDGVAVSTVTPTPATEGRSMAGGNGSGAGANQLFNPFGIFINGSGNKYVADTYNHRIQRWGENDTVGETVAGGNGFGSANNQLNGPTGIHVDNSGNMYVADQYNHRVQMWTPGATEGVTVAGGNGAGTEANQLYQPWGVFVDGSGNIYVADQNNHRIQKWTPGATEGITVAGGNGSGGSANQLTYPKGVYVDEDGAVYVTDGVNRVQKWTSGATSGTTVAGGNGWGSAANQFKSPGGVLVDSNGSIYVADAENYRVQKWTPGATEGVTVAGGNGVGSAANQLYNPYGLYVDLSGNIYVADSYNHRIQKWAAPSIATTFTPTEAGVYTAAVAFESGTVTTNADTVHEALVVATPAAISQANDVGLCSAVVALANPDIIYNCEIGLISNDAPTGNVFPVGTTQVNWSVADAYGNITTVTQEVTILDKEAPVVLTQPLIVALDDAGNATIIASQVDSSSYDNCGIATMSLNQYSFGCTNLGPNTITLTVTDIHGNTATASTVVTVEDRIQPLVTAPADITVGNDPAKCGALVEIGLATATDNCSVATMSNNAPTDGFFPVGITEVIWSAVDGSGNMGTAVQYITVTNEVPVLGDIVLPVDPQPLGQAIQASVSYLDNNADYAVWNWGDGAESFGEVLAAEVTGTHTYTTAGVYTITLTLYDMCGEYDISSNVQDATSSSGARISSTSARISSTSTSYEFTYLVSYDPSGGFVTGGGWIYSPPGAYVLNTAAEGKASFGFVAKYKKGASIPEGNTEFRFNAAGFEFRSTSYEWLVVAGAKAMYKGYGAVNGEPGYGFLLSAIDGDKKTIPEADKFRIKIWDSAGTTIYDNQMGAADDADATMALSGGSIVIHEEKKESSTSARLASGEKSSIEGFTAYPNPLAQKGLWLEFPAMEKSQNFHAYIYDLSGRALVNRVFDVPERGGKQLWEVDHSTWANGTYLLVIQGDKVIQQLKIIKQIVIL